MVTADSVKAKIQALIAKANSTTGKSDTDLTSGVNSLVDGYGQGDPVPVWDEEDYTLSDDTEEITGREPLLKEKTITANDTYLASADGADGYSKVIVNVAGGGGESSLEYVIEVDVLPTDSAAIEKNALYKMGGETLADIVLNTGGVALSILEDTTSRFELLYVSTKPTKNIKVSGAEVFYFYYVEDEDDISVYGDFQETGSDQWVSVSKLFNDPDSALLWVNGGAITDISEATTDGCYYAVVDRSTAFYQYINGEWVSACDQVVTVGVLPETGIKNALYKYGGSYYWYKKEFRDIIWIRDGVTHSTVTNPGDGIYRLYYVDRYENVENPTPWLQSIILVTLYYDESRNGIFGYSSDSNEWQPITELVAWLPDADGGAITDISQATQDNTIYALVSDWRNYILPRGTLTITESGTYDVKRYEGVIVDVPDAAICGIWRFNEQVGVGKINHEQPVNFTTVIESNIIECSGIYINAYNYFEPTQLAYYDREGNDLGVYNFPGFVYDSARTVDFGAEPQIVTSAFKEWLVANATPIYTITRTE